MFPAKDWRQMYEGLRANAQILIVDDEPFICQALEQALAPDGFGTTSAASADEAWEALQRERFDFLVVDQSLPTSSGLDLLSRIRDERLDLPALVITAYASMSSVAVALATGALGFVAKPFGDVTRVARQIVDVVEPRVLGRLCDHMIADLSRMLLTQGEDRKLAAAVAAELQAAKAAIGCRPDLLIVDGEAAVARRLADDLRASQLSVKVETTVDGALDVLDRPDAPLVAVVTLEMKDALRFLGDARTRDPLLGLLVASSDPRLRSTLAALEQGATGLFLRAVESSDVLALRARHLLAAGRRQRLCRHLIASLLRAAAGEKDLQELLQDIARRSQIVLETPPEATGGAGPAGSEPSFDDLFVETGGEGANRRSHPRYRGDLPAFISANDRTVRGRLWDVSRGGLFVRMRQPFAPGTRVEIQVFADPTDAGALRIIAGHVVRSVSHDPDPDCLSGCGVLADEHSQTALAEVIARIPKAQLPPPPPGKRA
jgi:DNA-binding response OmpR family regulator